MPGPQDPLPDEDAAWRSIVDNYGARADLGDGLEEPAAPEPVDPFPSLSRRPEPEPVPELQVEREEHYVPPPPPPVAVPVHEPARLIAWAGLLGVPLFVVVDVMAHLAVPSWLVLLLVVWFVGGFVFLVATMRPGPPDDDDDGAVV